VGFVMNARLWWEDRVFVVAVGAVVRRSPKVNKIKCGASTGGVPRVVSTTGLVPRVFEPGQVKSQTQHTPYVEAALRIACSASPAYFLY